MNERGAECGGALERFERMDRLFEEELVEYASFRRWRDEPGGPVHSSSEAVRREAREPEANTTLPASRGGSSPA